MGGGLEADLSQGAVPVLWSDPPTMAPVWQWHPVLQVADVRHVPDGTGLRPAPAWYQRHRVLLSDGVYSQHARLVPALNHLASGGDLRRGSVVRLLRFVPAPDPDHVRTILIIQLEILQTNCALIGSLKLYKPTRNSGVLSTSRSMSYGLRSDCKPFGAVQMGPSCGSYPSDGGKLSSVTLSEKPSVWKVVGQIKDENLGYSDKPDFITVKATISSVNPGLILCYVACPLVVNGKRCNAKATRVDGMWRCKSCEYGFLQSSENGWSIRIQIQDHTGMTSATVCEEAAEEIFGCRGRDLYSLKYKDQDYAQLHDILMGAMLKQYVFQLKVEGLVPQPVFSEVCRVECIVLKAEKVNPSAECHRLLGQIDTLLQEGSRPPGQKNRTPLSKNDASHLVPVAQLSPYQERWTIKARVTAKTDLRHYNNAKGGVKVFSFDLLDGQGGEIRATCFNAQADQFFNLIEVDKVYLISKGSVKPAWKKLNSLNHEYEIILDFRTSVEVCVDGDSNIPRQQYNFRQISEIENIEIGAFVDLVGIVTSVGPSTKMMQKDGTRAQKRTLQLKDMSLRSMEIILWVKFCDTEGHQLQLLCDSGSNPILCLKGGRVSDFRGRSVVVISSTQLKVNPDFPVAEMLKQWYITEGKNTACISLSREISNMSRNHVLKTIAQIKDENLGRSGKPDVITVKAVLSHVGADKFCYQACTLEFNGRRCYKKVARNCDRTWYCDRCNQCTEYCEYRYLLSCQIKDHTGTTYASAFQEVGEAIFGHTAQELFMIRNAEQDDMRFKEIMEAALWREYLFKLRINEKTYNDEQRVRCTIIGVRKLDETNNLLKDVSRPILKDDSSYIPAVGSANLEARQSMLPSSNANGCATGFAQSNWMATPLSAASVGCDFNGGLMGQSPVSSEGSPTVLQMQPASALV